ncbi:hypothetical protein F5X99DRAFT_391614 [Biscogniauxia marginata]|nr:hypothetical protein F5X99DRAFT_391614 [Biscogniauxia marginata]
MQSICMHRRVVKVAWFWSRTLRGGDNFRIPGAVKLNCRRHVSSSRSPPPAAGGGGGGAKEQKVPAAKPLSFRPTSIKKPNTVPRSHKHEQAGSNNAKQPVADLVRNRWIALFGFGAAALCIGSFTASLAFHWYTDVPAPCYPLGCEPEVPTGRPLIQSPYEFDLHLDKSEHRYGITKLRRYLAAEARGHVLEVAIGTGRNLEFYDWGTVTEELVPPEERDKEEASWWWGKNKTNKAPGKGEQDRKAVLSFTGLDISPSMLDITLRRIRQVIPYMVDVVPKKPSFAQLASTNTITTADNNNTSIPAVSLVSNRIRILQSNAQSLPIPLPPTLTSSNQPPQPPPRYYDTVIQTFGLCSVRDPVALIANLARVVRPGSGRILLFEHGRSNWWEFVNGMLDRSARGHFERFGCWWNRDVEAIVREAERVIPGLEVRRLERPGWVTFGTNVLVELGVRQEEQRAKDGAKGVGKGSEGGEKKGWMSFFSSSAASPSSSSSSPPSSSALLSVKKRDDEPKKD